MFLPGGKYLYTHNRFPIRKSNAKLAPLEHVPIPEEGPSGVIFNEKKNKKAPLVEILKNSELRNANHYNVFYKNAKQTKKKLHLKKLEQSHSFLAKNNSMPDIKPNAVTATPKLFRGDEKITPEQLIYARLDLSSPQINNNNNSLNTETTMKILFSKQEPNTNSQSNPQDDLVLQGKAEEIHETPRRREVTNYENEAKPLNMLESSPVAKTENPKESDKFLAKPLHGTLYAIKSPRSNRQDSIENTPKLQMNKNNILIRSMNFWNYKPDYARELDGRLHFHNQKYVRKVESTLYQ